MSILGYLDSPNRARRVLWVYWALLAVGSHLPGLGVGKDANQFGVFQVDKALHVTAFAGLTFLLYQAKLCGGRASSFANAFTAMVIAAIYALIDEYTQRWTGRDISISDVVAGYIAILGVFLLLTTPKPKRHATSWTRIMRIVTGAAVAFVLVMALAPEGNRWVNQLARPFFQPWPQIDKTGHFYVSAGLTLLIALSYPAGVHRPRLGLFLTILVMGLAGPIIETAQSFTGRSVEMTDLYAHQVGLLAAMAALAAVAVVRALRPRLSG